MFDYCVGEREGISKKPSPDSVNEVLKKLEISRAEAVYIGDSEVDIETAANADMDCIIVSWGFRSEDYLKSMGAEKIVHSTDELAELL
jgi:phosphoglycolate phosphatase